MIRRGSRRSSIHSLPCVRQKKAQKGSVAQAPDRLAPSSLQSRLLAEVERLETLQEAERNLNELQHAQAMNSLNAESSAILQRQQLEEEYTSRAAAIIKEEEARAVQMQIEATNTLMEMQRAHQIEVESMRAHLQKLEAKVRASELAAGYEKEVGKIRADAAESMQAAHAAHAAQTEALLRQNRILEDAQARIIRAR